MNAAFLENMRCPLCRGDLLPSSGDGPGQNGSVHCDCREYPVVDGILLLNPDLPLGHILGLVRKGSIRGALSLALAPWRGLPLKLVKGLWPGAPAALLEMLPGDNPMRLLSQLYSPKGMPSFWELAPPYETVQWEYMRQRFASDSFFATSTLLPLAATRSGPLLDLGCGIGHYSFLLANQRKRSAHLCLDTEFLTLLIARHYFAHEADCVHVNGDLPLPFKDGCFDLVFGSDMLHYSRAKATSGAEIGRVLAADGLAILPHTHNAARKNPCPGTPLTLAGYRRILDSLSLACFPDDLLVRLALAGEAMDPTLKVDDATLEGSHAIAILAAHRPTAWLDTMHVAIDGPVGPARLIVNPVYDTAIEGGALVCRRRSLSNYFWEEYPTSRAYFPQELRFARNDLVDKARRQDLVRRFLLVRVPPAFMPPRPEDDWLAA